MTTTNPAGPKKKKSLGKKILIGIGVLFVIGAIGSQLDAKTETKDKDHSTATIENNSNLSQAQKDSIAQAEKSKELEEIKKSTFTAKHLVSEYEANEVNADNNFKGKTFYVSGEITDVKKDIMNEIYVSLEGGEGFRQVQCYFEDKDAAAKLSKGMTVTFKGKCDGLMMNVLMKDCELIQ